MALTLNDLTLIVESSQFDKLIGEVENDLFDAKGQPYQFDAGDYARREFAKDVTAFANASGGYIFIGVIAGRGTTQYGEEVKELRQIPRELIDPDRYYK